MKTIILVALCATLASCGTIMRGGPFHVPVASDPPGAVVRYLGAEVGVTPCTVAMRRSASVLELELAGHHKLSCDVGKTGNPWIFGNLLLGGIPGLFVDLITGATRTVDDRPVFVRLAPSTGPAPAPWTRGGAAPAAVAGRNFPE